MWKPSLMTAERIRYMNDVLKIGVLTYSNGYYFWRGVVIYDGKPQKRTYRIKNTTKEVEILVDEIEIKSSSER